MADPEEQDTLREAHGRLAEAERPLRAFNEPESLTDLSEAEARRLHALRHEQHDAELALRHVEQRIEDARLEFHE